MSTTEPATAGGPDSTIAAPGGGPNYLSHKQILVILGGLMAGMFLAALDQSIVGTALPQIVSEFNSLDKLSWVVTAYLLTSTASTPLWGKVSDLYGRRPLFIAAIVIFLAGSVLSAMSQNIEMLIGFRAVQGLGAGGLMSLAFATIGDVIPPRERGKYMGYFGAVFGLSSVAGPLLGGLLTDGPGWRWIFYLNVPVAILAGLGAFLLLGGENRVRRLSGFDLPGALLATSGMLLLIYALVRAPEIGWRATETVTTLALAVAVLAAFVVNERRARNPLVPFSIFRIEGLAAANLTQLITFGGLYSMFFFLSLYMQGVLGYSPSHTGLAYLPLTAGFMVSAAIATPLVPRVGTKPVIAAGALIAAGGLYFLSHVPVDGAFLGDLLPGILIVALGAGAVFTGVTTAATDGVPEDHAGVASGLLNASMQFGGALGLAVLSAVATDRTSAVLGSGGGLPVALTAGFQRAFLIGALVVLVAALVALLAGDPRSGTKARATRLVPATNDLSSE